MLPDVTFEQSYTFFISYTALLLSLIHIYTLGYKVFDTVEDAVVRHNDMQSYFFIKSARGADAKGLIVSDGFAVMKGSAIASSTVPSMPDNLMKLRSSLMKKE